MGKLRPTNDCIISFYHSKSHTRTIGSSDKCNSYTHRGEYCLGDRLQILVHVPLSKFPMHRRRRLWRRNPLLPLSVLLRRRPLQFRMEFQRTFPLSFPFKSGGNKKVQPFRFSPVCAQIALSLSIFLCNSTPSTCPSVRSAVRRCHNDEVVSALNSFTLLSQCRGRLVRVWVDRGYRVLS